MSQNIFDDPVFFEGYYQLRQGLNYKDLFEQPAMRRLLPDVAGKRVLDIGCGYGPIGVALGRWRRISPRSREKETYSRFC